MVALPTTHKPFPLLPRKITNWQSAFSTPTQLGQTDLNEYLCLIICAVNIHCCIYHTMNIHITVFIIQVQQRVKKLSKGAAYQFLILRH